jgi:D-alanyl-D-alanine carboxypeptidase/D-alanyl-D-alanine-endopeptidase (penicillin-binding protein 4)
MLKKLIKAKLNVDLSAAEIHDGSGISHYNMLTINQFEQILKSIKNRPHFQDFLQLMAKPGDEGTMNGRFAKHNIKLYAKTGTLHGITTIIGYFYSKNQLHSFVIATNNYLGIKDNYTQLEEKIIEIVTAE